MKNINLRNLLVVTVSFLISIPAMAHNSLESSMPAAGQSLPVSPETIELMFTDATYLESVELSLVGGNQVPLSIDKAVAAARHFSVAVPTLEKGEYEVNWVVIGDDTHEISGEFVFAVGQEVRSEMHSGHAEAGDHGAHNNHSGH